MAQCKWCGRKRIFLSITKIGLCKTCKSIIETKVHRYGRMIRYAENIVDNSNDVDERVKNCRYIVDRAKEIVKYEKKGIPTFTPLPSELIRDYTIKHDKIIMESMPEKVDESLTVAEDALTPLKRLNVVNEALQKVRDARGLLKDIRQKVKIIAIINQKGGVGKTTVTINIGSGLALLKKKVLLIDFDPQANLTDGMGIKEEEFKLSIYDLLKGNAKLEDVILERNGLSIIPANILLARTDKELLDNPQKYYMLKKGLKESENFDYVLIDCLPSLGILTLNALMAANEVYIPLQPEYFALKGIRKLLDAVDFVKEEGNNNLTITGMIYNRFDPRKIHHREVAAKVRESFGNKLFYTFIRENIALPESSSYGKSIFEYKPKSHGVEDYSWLCKRIVKSEKSR